MVTTMTIEFSIVWINSVHFC